MTEKSIAAAVSYHDSVMEEIHELTTIKGTDARVFELAGTMAHYHHNRNSFLDIAEELDQAFMLVTLVSAALGINALAASVSAYDEENAADILAKLENDRALLKPLYKDCFETLDALDLNRVALDALFD